MNIRSRRRRNTPRSRHIKLSLLGCTLILPCGLAACDRSAEQDEVAEVSTDQPTASQPIEPPVEHSIEPPVEHSIEQPVDQAEEGAASLMRAEPGFPWMVPNEWVRDETPRQMRIATYMAPTSAGDQEIAMTRFPGRVGGELANINRWRGQMGLAPINESELESNIDRFEHEGFDGYLVRIESERGVMLVAAVFDASISQTWFVRTTLSNANLADELKDDVLSVARSIMQ